MQWIDHLTKNSNSEHSRAGVPDERLGIARIGSGDQQEMTKQRPFECQFGVGNPDGKHRLWASRNTPDVYVIPLLGAHVLCFELSDEFSETR